MRESAHAGTPADAERRLLEERARELARPVHVGRGEDGVDVLAFRLGDERFGIEARLVHEVFPLQELARLPGARPPLFGVTPWRGDLLTLIDLRQALGTGERPLQDLNRVIVLGDGRAAFGVLVDAVEELDSLAGDAFHSLPEGEAAGLVRGITAAGLQMLDAELLVRTYG